jgi:hypothetical protein
VTTCTSLNHTWLLLPFYVPLVEDKMDLPTFSLKKKRPTSLLLLWLGRSSMTGFIVDPQAITHPTANMALLKPLNTNLQLVILIMKCSQRNLTLRLKLWGRSNLGSPPQMTINIF